MVQIAASDIPVLKAVEEIMDPAAFCAVRFFMSAIPFLPFMFQARDDVKIRNAGIELGLWVSLGYFVEALGLLTSDAGRASFISLFTVSSKFGSLYIYISITAFSNMFVYQKGVMT